MRRLATWLVRFAVVAAVVAIAYAFGLFDGADEPPPEAPLIERPDPPVVEEPPLIVNRTPAEERPDPAFAVPGGGITILQLGDSHTAADMFTGRARELLEAIYGEGGLILPPGEPQAGVRSNAAGIEASPGWTYESIRSADDMTRLWLSGFTAQAARRDETITFDMGAPLAFNAIELGFIAGPGAGLAELTIDDTVIETVDLAAAEQEPLFVRLVPPDNLGAFETLTVRTASAGPVAITSVSVVHDQAGLSYLSAGYPGAQVNALRSLDDVNFADDLVRLHPDFVVIAFGTNEGFDDNLNLELYRSRYEEIIDFIGEHRPEAEIVIIIPPFAGRGATCTGGNCPASGTGCWMVPPRLIGVREVLADIAADRGLAAWDWASALPSPCTIERDGENADYFASDRIHLSPTGYRASAERFVDFLRPLLPPPA